LGEEWLKENCKTGQLITFGMQIKDLASYKVVIESDSVFVETNQKNSKVLNHFEVYIKNCVMM